MSRPMPTKDHPWGTVGHNVPPDNTLSPELVEIIYGPHDITTTYEWILQNLPNHSVLELGEGRLMLGIFINAMTCLKTKKYANETWRWILDHEADGLYSFNSICYHLNWDPSWMRQGIIKLLETAPSDHTKTGYYQHYVAKRS